MISSYFMNVLAMESFRDSVTLQEGRLRRIALEMERPFSAALPKKCESCGSREFKTHHGQTICAYCRSTT